MRSLADAPIGQVVTVRAVDGPRAFRRRLLEMGLVPGVQIHVIAIAPLGDPLQLEVRGGQWSVRRAEAALIAIDERPQVSATGTLRAGDHEAA